jgi:alpha-D-ribose 1-methylphosphonate 5-triphosphate diphosphatase
MSARSLLTNARVVTPHGIADGSVAIDDGRIAEIVPRSYRDGTDLRGALLMPGVIDVHTDYLEKEISPRPGAEVPLEMALHVMDLRALSCGLTTVLSAARVSPERSGAAGSWHGDGLRLAREMHRLAPQMRARHLVHVRWDTRYEPVSADLAELAALDGIGNVVFNDSLPGVRQFRDMDTLVRKLALQSDLSFDAARDRMAEKISSLGAIDNRAEAAEVLRGRFPLGSHDDTTVEHVVEAHAFGATLCEMPVTIEAARKAKELGMLVCMGAPNYMRGGSHCGNLSADQAFAEGLVDMLCSDYHFPSLLACAVLMIDSGTPPPAVSALLSLNPARHLGIDAELGSIEPGKRADLTAFHPRDGYADVIRTWVDGESRLAVSDAAGVAALAR